MNQTTVTMNVRQISREISVIDIQGEITAAAENMLMDAYNEATSSGARFILLNFKDLEYMNSSGIGLLVTLLIRTQRQKQHLYAYGLSSHYQQIFELTRLNEAILIFPDEESALATARK